MVIKGEKMQTEMIRLITDVLSNVKTLKYEEVNVFANGKDKMALVICGLFIWEGYLYFEL
jgi:hypothetical protein